MADQGTQSGQFRQVISAEQIQKRIREMARHISDDYRGQTIHVLGVLENCFLFMADLVRLLEVPVVCNFIKPRYAQKAQAENRSAMLEIFFSQEFEIREKHVLLLEGLIHSGITTDFLIADLKARGVASVRTATLLDRQVARRVPMQPDYFGFLVDEAFLVGYGLSSSDQANRNLPFLAVPPGSPAAVAVT
ncbi:MAG TPA: phosphoribosyltransferase family protein [Terriglobales bacterium]|jgi:hypoxanthine phosphoribosyltransferase